MPQVAQEAEIFCSGIVARPETATQKAEILCSCAGTVPRLSRIKARVTLWI
jgi:hypothetical protein